MNYNVIGSDGAAYGPVDADTLKRWAAEARVMPNSMIEEVESGRRFAANTMPGLFPPTQAPQPSPAAPSAASKLHPGYDTPVQAQTGPGQTAPGQAGPAAAGPRFSPTTGYSSVTSGAPIPNNLVKSVIAMFCCLPFGIVALIFSLQVSAKQDAGDYYEAQSSASKANLFANIAIALMVISVLGIVVLYVIGTVFLHNLPPPHPAPTQ